MLGLGKFLGKTKILHRGASESSRGASTGSCAHRQTERGRRSRHCSVRFHSCLYEGHKWRRACIPLVQRRRAGIPLVQRLRQLLCARADLMADHAAMEAVSGEPGIGSTSTKLPNYCPNIYSIKYTSSPKLNNIQIRPIPHYRKNQIQIDSTVKQST
jgi:hypothetical protein